MKKLIALALGLLATSAIAADINKAPTYTATVNQPVYSWNGPWAGVLLGYAWKNEDTSITGIDKNAAFIINKGLFPSVIGLRPDGGTVGGRLGYDWQIAPRVVLGAIVDWSYSGMKDSAYAGGNLIGVNYSEKISNIGDIMGRAGYLLTDRTLLYVVGGGTWARVQNTVSSSGILPAFGAAASGASDSTRWGWSIGGGLEYRLDKVWSLDVSYLYSDLGTQTTLVTMPVGKSVLSWHNDEAVKFQRILLGIQGRFAPQ